MIKKLLILALILSVSSVASAVVYSTTNDGYTWSGTGWDGSGLMASDNGESGYDPQYGYVKFTGVMTSGVTSAILELSLEGSDIAGRNDEADDADITITIIADTADGWTEDTVHSAAFDPALGAESVTLSGLDLTIYDAASGGTILSWDVTSLVTGSDGSGNGTVGFWVSTPAASNGWFSFNDWEDNRAGAPDQGPTLRIVGSM
ncbi:hypothetical protein LCGC14_3025650, partial [marine sediment metagenome]